MAKTPAVSGQDSGNAGEAANTALDAAFDKAFSDVTASDEDFAPAAAGKPPTDETPDDATVTEDAAAADEGDEGQTDKSEEAGEETTPVETEPAQTAPEHWSAADREAFGKLPVDAQKLLMGVAKNLEAGFTRKSQELSEDRNFAQTVRSLASPAHMQQLRNAGFVDARGNPDLAQGFRHLLSLQDYATRDLPGYIRWVAQQGQLQPQQIFPQLTGGEQPAEGEQPEAPQLDPYTQQLYGTLQQLSTRLDSFEHQQQESQNRLAANAIDAFRAAADASGQPLYPHMPKVENAMVQILASDPDVRAVPDLGERLKRAYELAVYRDPSIRSELIDAEVRTRMAQTAKQAELAKAKRAKAPIQTGAPVNEAAPKPKTLEEATHQAFDALLS